VNRKVAIACDFDGTIASRDVGHCFFERYVPDAAARDELLERWMMGLVSSRECLDSEIAWVQADAGDLDRFADGEALDPFFGDFVDFCNRRRYEFVVLSDGLDRYIDRMLMNAALGYLHVRSNHLVVDDGRLAGIEYPWYDRLDCTMCANCKRFHVEQLSGKGFFVVYVGNGYSDRCPAAFADLVLAKGELLEHCEQEGIASVPWRNFRDVERELTNRLVLAGDD